MPESFYDIVWIFFVYAIIGWCVEVAYAAVHRGEFVNRGFLNGPWCPIYGCGMCLVIFFLYPLKDNIIILFLGSMLLTSILEFLTGYFLEKVFHSKWWDYTDMPFNVKGYICLQFSLIWGFAGTFIIDIIHPILFAMIQWIPFVPGCVILIILGIIFITDASLTISTILKMNRRLRILEELSQGLRSISDDIGQNIFENVETITDIANDARLLISENTMEAKSEYAAKKEYMNEHIEKWKENNQIQLQEFRQKYQEAFSRQRFGERRLIKAFPDVKYLNRNEILEKYKNYLLSRKKEKQEEERIDDSRN